MLETRPTKFPDVTIVAPVCAPLDGEPILSPKDAAL
jgi:hypothetical protein